jgi:hypothetical protein
MKWLRVLDANNLTTYTAMANSDVTFYKLNTHHTKTLVNNTKRGFNSQYFKATPTYRLFEPLHNNRAKATY